MNDQILSVLKAISDFNQMTNKSKNAWEVVPEMCYHTDLKTFKVTFVEEVMKFVEKNGTINRNQSAEETGAVGQSYFIDSAKLLAHFKCELVKK